jgi:hypothetical protein
VYLLEDAQSDVELPPSSIVIYLIFNAQHDLAPTPPFLPAPSVSALLF